MQKRIKHVSELPAWFKLTNYEFTKNLDSFDWFKQLIVREPHGIKSSHLNYEPNQELTLKKFTPLIRANPHLYIDDHTALSLFSLTHPDTENFENYLGTNLVKSKKAAQNSMIALYQVNYNFSDEFLVESFKKHLAIARKKHKSIYREPYRKSDFQHWAKLGVLPCLDLLIWSLHEHKHITHRVLANALYPYGDKGEETIRKTTLPLIEEIVSPYSMIQLYAQARTTIIEKNLL